MIKNGKVSPQTPESDCPYNRMVICGDHLLGRDACRGCGWCPAVDRVRRLVLHSPQWPGMERFMQTRKLRW